MKVTYACNQMIIIITDDVMIMIVNNVESTKLEYLNSVVPTVTYMYETIDTRCDTEWTNNTFLNTRKSNFANPTVPSLRGPRNSAD